MRLVVCGWLGTRNATAHSTLLSVSIGQPRLGTVTLWQESIGWADQRQGRGGWVLGTPPCATMTLWQAGQGRHYDTLTGEHWQWGAGWHGLMRCAGIRSDAARPALRIYSQVHILHFFCPDPSSWVMGGMTSPHPAQSGYQCCSVPWPVELLTKVYTKTTIGPSPGK